MGIQFENKGSQWYVLRDGKRIITIDVPSGCNDSFELINDKAFYWRRKCDAPVTEMRLTMKMEYEPRYFQVPGVNYNGNGWGSGAQYYGYGTEQEPWVYAWHRTAIPACTYTESDTHAVALFGEEKGGMSCSLYPKDGGIVQELIWPEKETPKVLFKRSWEPPYYGTMEPTDNFCGVVMLMDAEKPRERVKDLMDFAWDFFYRKVSMPYSPEKVRKLDLLFIRQLWHRKYNGMVGFCSGVNWDAEYSSYMHRSERFEIGWVGQNGTKACALLEEYLETGDTHARDKGLSVLDSWCEHSTLPNGLMFVHLIEPPSNVDSKTNGDIPMELDSCNLSWAASSFFWAADVCKKAGIDRPNYERRAFELCDFFVRSQQESGEFAKTYFVDGSIDSPHGSTGAFAVLPLFEAYEKTKNEAYLNAALNGLEFYLSEFLKIGHTTAGALDSNCIDKESGAPILRGAIKAYELTKKQEYLDGAVEMAYYLATWQWHYSVVYPETSMLGELKVDTYGSTSVSAAHHALDHYGLYWIPEYIKLTELTGNKVWEQRARALWYSGTQLLSDGTLVINGRVRPAGSQDESFRHTRWGRPDHRYFTTSEWCTSWQGCFRHIALKAMKSWDVLR